MGFIVGLSTALAPFTTVFVSYRIEFQVYASHGLTDGSTYQAEVEFGTAFLGQGLLKDQDKTKCILLNFTCMF
jgi:hypothetical protein